MIELTYKLGLLIGGTIGLYLAWKRVSAANRQAEAQIKQAEAAARQAELGSRKQAAELFQQSVGLLRDEKLEIRLLAVYNLGSLARDNPTEQIAVLSLLAAYLRDNPRSWGDDEPPADVREILRVLQTELLEKPSK